MGVIRFVTTDGDTCIFNGYMTWLDFLKRWSETPEDGLIPVRGGFFDYDQQFKQKRNIVEVSYEEE